MLAFDTSASVTAVALLEDARVLAEDSTPSDERHAESLLPRVQHCLSQAAVALRDIDVFAVGIGPGSFTGVRVGVATAKGLALATGKPVRGVVSLAALAWSARELAPAADVLVAPILEAYKGEVFAALYAIGPERSELVVPPLHAAPEAAAAQLAAAAAGRAVHVLGSGYRRYAQQLGAGWDVRPLAAEWDAPRARHIAAEARRLLAQEGPSDLGLLAPLYVRGSDAQLPKTPLKL
ncbi:MAG TPA: tRNA (adenosine(37)-N6)-threonylcarbamoyltransferase complex dimerization subunit type 1 TsaB [Polyangiales bacterium]|nr:tRNA (adenosine(37)-N6)-threonylcarbamoyltransferase complex dimerization subunit type 1 TsaB [Polyangiales bacterium]